MEAQAKKEMKGKSAAEGQLAPCEGALPQHSCFPDLKGMRSMSCTALCVYLCRNLKAYVLLMCI